MYPHREVQLDAAFPHVADYWVPSRASGDDEGYGLAFRDVYALRDVSIAEAAGVLEWKRTAAAWADEHANDEARFEQLAQLAET